jgi:8-oxo-dGTP pyrophosphatase MutT (NUDIX family)
MEKQTEYCNNCGKPGHVYHQCKMPIISIGTIVFKKTKSDTIEFLMIRRKHSLGFMDFMRGKYSIYNKHYILNLLNEMTVHEKESLITNTFSELWKKLWGNQTLSTQYKTEEKESNEKFYSLLSGIHTSPYGTYTLKSLIQESNTISQWEEPEWGFPKGRRNLNENDIDCAKREFSEETGYQKISLTMIYNLLPFEEIFIGSNYKSYKHKYYLMQFNENLNKYYSSKYDKSEVSKIEWKTYEECLEIVRPYNLEKIKMIKDIYYCLLDCKII